MRHRRVCLIALAALLGLTSCSNDSEGDAGSTTSSTIATDAADRVNTTAGGGSATEPDFETAAATDGRTGDTSTTQAPPQTAPPR